MPEKQLHPPITIHHDDALAYSGAQWQSRQTHYVQIYGEFVSSGLLTKIPGSALKILLTMALNAGQLGVGSADQQHFFETLKQKNVFSEADRGQLFCYLDHDTLCQQTGLSKNTVTAHTEILADLGLVEKRVIKKGHGEGSYNLFFIRPAAHIDKNNALHPEKNAVPKTGTANPSTAPKNWERNPKSDSKTGTNLIDSDPDSDDWNLDSIFDYFAKRKNVSRYRPTAHDRKHLTDLRAAGCTTRLMQHAIDVAFDTRPTGAPPIRQLSFCAPIARRLLADATTTAAPAQHTSPDSTTGDPASPVEYAAILYQQTFGTPPAGKTAQELAELVQQYPDTALLTEAFRRAKKYHAQSLAYIRTILQNETRPPAPATAAEVLAPSPLPPPELSPTELFWENFLAHIRGQMTRAAFNQWIAPLRIVEMTGERVVVGTKNIYAQDWLENRLRKVVEYAVSVVNGTPLTVEFTVI